MINPGNSALNDSFTQRSPETSSQSDPAMHKAEIHEDMAGNISRKMHGMRNSGQEESSKFKGLQSRRTRLWDMASKVHGEY